MGGIDLGKESSCSTRKVVEQNWVLEGSSSRVARPRSAGGGRVDLLMEKSGCADYSRTAPPLEVVRDKRSSGGREGFYPRGEDTRKSFRQEQR